MLKLSNVNRSSHLHFNQSIKVLPGQETDFMLINQMTIFSNFILKILIEATDIKREQEGNLTLKIHSKRIFTPKVW